MILATHLQEKDSLLLGHDPQLAEHQLTLEQSRRQHEAIRISVLLLRPKAGMISLPSPSAQAAAPVNVSHGRQVDRAKPAAGTRTLSIARPTVPLARGRRNDAHPAKALLRPRGALTCRGRLGPVCQARHTFQLVFPGPVLRQHTQLGTEAKGKREAPRMSQEA